MFIEVKDSDLIKTVAKLAAEIWTEHYTPIIGKDQVEYMLEKFQSQAAITEQINQGCQYFLIKDNRDFAGYFAIQPKQDELFLSKFYVKPSCQGRGLGRKSLNFIEEIALEKGFTKITLTVNKHNTKSIKIYEKLGFKNAGPLTTDIGNGFVMDDYKLKKILE